MWIEQTSKGLRLYDRYKDMDGKTHKISVPLPKNTAQARKKAAAELQNKIAINSTLGDKSLIKSLIERYLKSKDIKPSSLTNYRSAFKQMVDIFGNVPITDLTSPYIKRKMSESDRSPKTLNRYLALLQDFLSWCADQGYIEIVPHIRKFQDKTPKRDPDQEYLEADELQAVLDQVIGTMYYYVFKFLALTGCRTGEMAALTLSDIDGKYIHITKAYKRENGISTPKTASSVRDIYIQPELKALLKEYKEWRLLYQMARGIRTDLLFFTIHGEYMSSNALLHKLMKLQSNKHLHPHIFRHTHTALLAEQGYPLEAIARRLGHTDSIITKKIYFHVTERTKNADESLMEKIQLL